MQPWAAVTARPMFGGHGLYRDGLMFAIAYGDVLYLKADAHNAKAFATAGGAPFVYTARGRTVRLGYWSVPAECAESPSEMARWCSLGWQAALSSQAMSSARRCRGKPHGDGDTGPPTATAPSRRGRRG